MCFELKNSELGLAKKVVLPVFYLTKVCSIDEEGVTKRTLPTGTSPREQSYYYKRTTLYPFNISNGDLLKGYNLFPVIISGDGGLWKEANLFLLSRAQDFCDADMSTLNSIASDLVEFKRFLEDEEVDYRAFPKKKFFRPTYRYRKYIEDKVLTKKLSASVGNRTLSTVRAFYRWLISEKLLNPENPVCVEGKVSITTKNAYGFSKQKSISTSDISLNIPKVEDPYSDTLEGGLKPLTQVEQKSLIRVLVNLGNTEMLLIHLFSLFTGARIQTVLTIQCSHIQAKVHPDRNGYVKLPVGFGTGIDTKNDKQQTLLVPHFLWEKLVVYSYSKRAKKRRVKSGRPDAEQYLFLSSHGLPFYTSKKERRTFDESLTLHHEKNGQAVRIYISSTVIPNLKRSLGNDFSYRFHDLRASFGMNETDFQLSRVQRGEITLFQAREYVKFRMGHESASTTDGYINYRENQKFIIDVQIKYDAHLKDLVGQINSYQYE